MAETSRREFLKDAALASAAITTSTIEGSFGSALAQPPSVESGNLHCLTKSHTLLAGRESAAPEYGSQFRSAVVAWSSGTQRSLPPQRSG